MYECLRKVFSDDMFEFFVCGLYLLKIWNRELEIKMKSLKMIGGGYRCTFFWILVFVKVMFFYFFIGYSNVYLLRMYCK